jgi:hypothetical protein
MYLRFVRQVMPLVFHLFVVLAYLLPLVQLVLVVKMLHY